MCDNGLHALFIYNAKSVANISWYYFELKPKRAYYIIYSMNSIYNWMSRAWEMQPHRTSFTKDPF